MNGGLRRRARGGRGTRRASGEDMGSWWLMTHVDQVWSEHVKWRGYYDLGVKSERVRKRWQT